MPVVIAPLLLPMLAMLLALLYYAMRAGMFTLLQAAIDSISTGIPGLSQIASGVRKGFNTVLHFIEKRIADAALAIEAPAVAFVLHLAGVVESWAFSGYYTAIRAGHAFTILRRVTLPRLIHAATIDLKALPHKLGIGVGTLRAELRADIRRLGAAERSAVYDLRAAARAIHAAYGAAVTGTGAIADVYPWAGRKIGEATSAAETALRGLRDVRNVLLGATLVGLLARALGRLGAGNIRCTNVKHLNRRVCGADPALLESLLGALTIVIGTVSLVEFARACQTVEGEIAAGVQSFLRP